MPEGVDVDGRDVGFDAVEIWLPSRIARSRKILTNARILMIGREIFHKNTIQSCMDLEKKTARI